MTYYNPEERRQIHEKWIARMADWQSSGLSGIAWCKKYEIAYHQFTYWKKRLRTKTAQNPNPHSFIELDDLSESSGIEIVIKDISLRLSKDFDSSTLLRCLRTLKEEKC